jgi:hypothetical protein
METRVQVGVIPKGCPLSKRNLWSWRIGEETVLEGLRFHGFPFSILTEDSVVSPVHSVDGVTFQSLISPYQTLISYVANATSEEGIWTEEG